MLTTNKYVKIISENFFPVILDEIINTGAEAFELFKYIDKYINKNDDKFDIHQFFLDVRNNYEEISKKPVIKLLPEEISDFTDDDIHTIENQFKFESETAHNKYGYLLCAVIKAIYNPKFINQLNIKINKINPKETNFYDAKKNITKNTSYNLVESFLKSDRIVITDKKYITTLENKKKKIDTYSFFKVYAQGEYSKLSIGYEYIFNKEKEVKEIDFQKISNFGFESMLQDDRICLYTEIENILIHISEKNRQKFKKLTSCFFLLVKIQQLQKIKNSSCETENHSKTEYSKIERINKQINKYQRYLENDINKIIRILQDFNGTYIPICLNDDYANTEIKFHQKLNQCLEFKENMTASDKRNNNSISFDKVEKEVESREESSKQFENNINECESKEGKILHSIVEKMFPNDKNFTDCIGECISHVEQTDEIRAERIDIFIDTLKKSCINNQAKKIIENERNTDNSDLQQTEKKNNLQKKLSWKEEYEKYHKILKAPLCEIKIDYLFRMLNGGHVKYEGLFNKYYNYKKTQGFEYTPSINKDEFINKWKLIEETFWSEVNG